LTKEINYLHALYDFKVDQETLEPKRKLAEEAVEWCKSIGTGTGFIIRRYLYYPYFYLTCLLSCRVII
jgi:hypothetical protein